MRVRCYLLAPEVKESETVFRFHIPGPLRERVVACAIPNYWAPKAVAERLRAVAANLEAAGEATEKEGQ